MGNMVVDIYYLKGFNDSSQCLVVKGNFNKCVIMQIKIWLNI